MKTILILLLLNFCLTGCSEQSETSSATKSAQSVAERIEKPETASAAVSKRSTEPSKKSEVIPSALSVNEAEALIFELPEIKAWSNYIEQKSQGKVHGSILTTSKEPQDIDGKQYWPINFYESQETHMHRWESFFVRIDGKEILVDDLADGPISLKDWRDQKKPLERINS